MRTAAQVFKKFGPKLKIKDEIQKATVELFYPDSLKTKIDFKKGKADINVQNLCINVDKIQDRIDQIRKLPLCVNTWVVKKLRI